jgi:Rho-binding antiterminator
MSSNSYRPIDCDFHDQIESLATTRHRVHVTYKDEGGGLAARDGIIVDVYTAPSKEEFLKLEDGTTIRLDRITDVHGIVAA